MPINDRTVRLNLPLPHVDNLLEDDVARLREALTTIDTEFPDVSTTDTVSEGVINQYFTVSRVRAVLLNGLSVATNAAIVAGDSLLAALGKLQAQLTAQLAVITAHVGAGGSAHSAATGSVAGFMSAADKTALDVHIGSTGASHGPATASVAGFMHAADKAKLDAVTFVAPFTEVSVTPTAGQTEFTVAGGYVVGLLWVFVNGSKFIKADDVVATNGTSFTLTTAVGITDTVEYIVFKRALAA